MSPVAGPVAAAALLLAVAGIAKLRRPTATAGALRSAGLPSGRGWVMALGTVEVAAGAWALLAGGPLACALVAVLYLGFAAFTARLLSVDGSSSCGCFGEAGTATSPLHVGVNAGLGLAVAVGAARPPDGLPAMLADQPLDAVVLIALAGLGAWAAYLSLTLLVDLAARSRPSGTP